MIRRNSRSPQLHTLICEGCRVVTRGAAALWIALVVPDDERLDEEALAVYCPRCAEAYFQFFSRPRYRYSR